MSLEYERGKCSGVGLVHGKFEFGRLVSTIKGMGRLGMSFLVIGKFQLRVLCLEVRYVVPVPVYR
jgi:hypothetical protein